MPYYTTEECSTAIAAYLESIKAQLTPTGGDPVQDIWPAEQKLVPRYPAIMVAPGPLSRMLVATGMQVELTLRVMIYVMHAKLTKTRTQRTQEDIKMSREVVKKLHENRTLSGNVVVGLVTGEDPGSLAGPQGLAVVGTRLTWEGQQREKLWNV